MAGATKAGASPLIAAMAPATPSVAGTARPVEVPALPGVSGAGGRSGAGAAGGGHLRARVRGWRAPGADPAAALPGGRLAAAILSVTFTFSRSHWRLPHLPAFSWAPTVASKWRQ